MRQATRTKSDGVPRPQPAGVWRFDLSYAQFSSAQSRVSIDLRPKGLAAGDDLLILAAWVEVGTAWAGTTGTPVLDLGCLNRSANEFLHAAPLAAEGRAGDTQAARGIASARMASLLDGDLTATVDVGSSQCDQLTAGAASVYVVYAETTHDDHVETPHETPVQVTDPGRGSVGIPGVGTLENPLFTDYLVSAFDTEDVGAGTRPTKAVFRDGLRALFLRVPPGFRSTSSLCER